MAKAEPAEEAPAKAARKDLPEAAAIVQECRQVEAALGLVRLRDLAVLSHYYGAGGYGQLGAYDTLQPSTKVRALEGMSHSNVMKNVIDTSLSQNVRSPNFTIQSFGNPWKVQMASRKAEQWVKGSNKKAGMARIKWKVCTDAYTCSAAAARFWFDEDGLHACRQRPDTIIWNPKDGYDPDRIWLRYGVDKEELCAQFPAFAKVIREKGKKYQAHALYEALDLLCHVETDQVEVIEHWKRAKGKKRPGHYSIVCGDTILNPADRDWEDEFFPLAELVFSEGWDSFGGNSLGQQLLGDQMQLNKMVKIIDNAQAKMSISRTYVPKGSEVDKNQLSKNNPGEYVDYNAAGGKIEIRPAVAISAEYYQRLENIERGMYQRAGVSEMAATNQVPAGLASASGKAVQMHDGRTQSRAKAIADAIDRFDEKSGKVGLALALRFFKKNPGEMAKVRAAGSSVLKEIDFSELNIQEMDGVSINVAAISPLPTDQSARLDYVTKLIEGGFASKKYGAKLLSTADVEALEDELNSAYDLAMSHIEDTLGDGKVVTPEANREYLEILLDVGQRCLMKALRIDDVPEKNTELMRRLLEVAQNQLDGMPSAGGPMPGGPPVPGGAGGVPALGMPQPGQLMPAAAPMWGG